MRNFIDFEFIENGRRHSIIPISLGIVREDEVSFYIEFEDVNWDLANQWVLSNVKPYITGETTSLEDARRQIVEFVGPNPEFWGYYADYDWVIMCQLFGEMMDLPTDWPNLCFDIRQYMWHLEVDREDITIKNEYEHNALADARWNKQAFDFLLEYQMSLVEQ